MKNRLLRGAALAALGAALCVPAAAQNSPHQQTPHTKLSNPPADAVSEAQIVATLDAVDAHEIAAAQAAIERSRNEEVLAFARQMIVDHGDSRRRLGEVGIQPVQGELTRKFQDKARMSENRLSKLEGDKFDRAYMAAMVEGHANVLEKLDRKFIPAAKTGALATHLQERRPAIEAHHEHAKRIKAALGTK